jgi:hypothetical protein
MSGHSIATATSCVPGIREGAFGSNGESRMLASVAAQHRMLDAGIPPYVPSGDPQPARVIGVAS